MGSHRYPHQQGHAALGSLAAETEGLGEDRQLCPLAWGTRNRHHGIKEKKKKKQRQGGASCHPQLGQEGTHSDLSGPPLSLSGEVDFQDWRVNGD